MLAKTVLSSCGLRQAMGEALRLFGLYERVRITTLAKLHADIEMGWKDLEAGRMSEFDPQDIKRRGRKRLAEWRLGSGRNRR